MIILQKTALKLDENKVQILEIAFGWNNLRSHKRYRKYVDTLPEALSVIVSGKLIYLFIKYFSVIILGPRGSC